MCCMHGTCKPKSQDPASPECEMGHTCVGLLPVVQIGKNQIYKQSAFCMFSDQLRRGTSFWPSDWPWNCFWSRSLSAWADAKSTGQTRSKHSVSLNLLMPISEYHHVSSSCQRLDTCQIFATRILKIVLMIFYVLLHSVMLYARWCQSGIYLGRAVAPQGQMACVWISWVRCCSSWISAVSFAAWSRNQSHWVFRVLVAKYVWLNILEIYWRKVKHHKSDLMIYTYPNFSGISKRGREALFSSAEASDIDSVLTLLLLKLIDTWDSAWRLRQGLRFACRYTSEARSVVSLMMFWSTRAVSASTESLALLVQLRNFGNPPKQPPRTILFETVFQKCLFFVCPSFFSPKSARKKLGQYAVAQIW